MSPGISIYKPLESALHYKEAAQFKGKRPSWDPAINIEYTDSAPAVLGLSYSYISICVFVCEVINTSEN